MLYPNSVLCYFLVNSLSKESWIPCSHQKSDVSEDEEEKEPEVLKPSPDVDTVLLFTKPDNQRELPQPLSVIAPNLSIPCNN